MNRSLAVCAQPQLVLNSGLAEDFSAYEPYLRKTEGKTPQKAERCDYWQDIIWTGAPMPYSRFWSLSDAIRAR